VSIRQVSCSSIRPQPQFPGPGANAQCLPPLAAQPANGDNSSVKTVRLAVDPSQPDTQEYRDAIARAAEILRAGGLVALPTETVYGLGANALDPAAVARIFAAKQRPAWDPVIVHVAGPIHRNPMLEELVAEIPPAARGLMEAFWPGPLTLLLKRSAAVPDSVSAGRPLVGIRMPAHPVAFELIRHAGLPVAAPSANVFGHISPTTAAHVLHDLDGRIDAVLDAGPTLHGVESTVLDPNQSPMMIYRPGAITANQIRDIAGPVDYYAPLTLPEAVPPEALPSPGVGLRHYAPRARLILVDASLSELPAQLSAAALPFAKERLGVMLPAEVAKMELKPPLRGAADFAWGRWSAPEELASALYAGLRALDAAECDVIVCPLPPEMGVGAAIRDRLLKAARTFRK
jgi:L-threonylcarbamoyladenylate synthase